MFQVAHQAAERRPSCSHVERGSGNFDSLGGTGDPPTAASPFHAVCDCVFPFAAVPCSRSSETPEAPTGFPLALTAMSGSPNAVESCSLVGTAHPETNFRSGERDSVRDLARMSHFSTDC